MNATVVNSTTLDTSGGGTVGNDYGGTYGHSTTGYSPAQNAEAYNGGSRQIALEENLTDKEKEIYQTKVSELNKKSNFKGNISTFSINFNQNKLLNGSSQDLTKLGFEIYQGGTFYGGGNGAGIPIPKEYIGSRNKNLLRFCGSYTASFRIDKYTLYFWWPRHF
jgi:hypothetical protein